MEFEKTTDCTAQFAEDFHLALCETHGAAVALMQQWDAAGLPADGNHALVNLRLCLILVEVVAQTRDVYDVWQEERERTAPTAAFGMKRAEA